MSSTSIKKTTHRACGGKVSEERNQWRCLGCGARWSSGQVDTMGASGRLRTVFEIKWEHGISIGIATPEQRWVLVEATDGKRRFTRLVPG